MGNTKKHLSRCSTIHYIKLAYRSFLFLIACGIYVLGKIYHQDFLFHGIAGYPVFLTLLCVVFGVEMILRMFPSKTESMGCQKQFRKNYKPIPGSSPKLNTGKRAAVVVCAWLALNSIISLLYVTNILDRGTLLLISLFYSVSDMICILFFCPFQTLIMKNKCCTTCRIYNWDFAMIVTPLVMIPNLFTWILLFLALVLLVLWEVRLHRHPERFLESCNGNLSCANCQEKLCSHKKQLRYLLLKSRKTAREATAEK